MKKKKERKKTGADAPGIRKVENPPEACPTRNRIPQEFELDNPPEHKFLFRGKEPPPPPGVSTSRSLLPRTPSSTISALPQPYFQTPAESLGISENPEDELEFWAVDDKSVQAPMDIGSDFPTTFHTSNYIGPYPCGLGVEDTWLVPHMQQFWGSHYNDFGLPISIEYPQDFGYCGLTELGEGRE